MVYLNGNVDCIQKFFDYEVDSDDEWEEEEPGESLHGSDDEKDKESDDEYDIDNEFFVPHGHLSDEEVMAGDEEADDEDNTPETQKAKLKIVQMEFADEMKKKTQKIKPRLIGLIWQQPNGKLPSSCASVISDMLHSRAMIFHGPTIKLQKTDTALENIDGNDEDSKAATTSKRRVLADTEIADLIRLVHGNVFGRANLVLEFQEFLRKKDITMSNAAIKNQISKLAKYQSCPDEGELLSKLCWYVSPEYRQQYGVPDVSIPNTWSYSLDNLKARVADPKFEKKVKQVDATAVAVEESKTPKSRFNISNFTKVLTEDDKKKQFKTASAKKTKPIEMPSSTLAKLSPSKTASVSASKITQSSASASGSGAGVVKKRVNLLMSVPRGQTIPTIAKNALISNFLKNTPQSTSDPKSTPPTSETKPVSTISEPTTSPHTETID